MNKRVTICVLMYGNYPALARQVVESIVLRCDREQYKLMIGCNACCEETLQFLASVKQIDRLIVSPENINKCPMQRQMFEQVDTEFVWWFDDDSWIEDDRSLQMRLEISDAAPPQTVLWGPIFMASCH